VKNCRIDLGLHYGLGLDRLHRRLTGQDRPLVVLPKGKYYFCPVEDENGGHTIFGQHVDPSTGTLRDLTAEEVAKLALFFCQYMNSLEE
jgi:hypothetical protein